MEIYGVASIHSVALSHAMSNKDLQMLRVYLRDYKRTPNGDFISTIKKTSKGYELSIILSLQDYLFNEGDEVNRLYDYLEDCMNTKDIDYDVVSESWFA